ncbi:LysE family translocator [Paracoccaceae bacterium]|nr:LysE family translocator [Paracoccaceae bacterium]
MINLSFIPFAFSQVATPGPANMAMLATGARFGFRAALPFVAGVILGKQLIIWPIGYGIMEVASQIPILFEILKFLSALYIIWLAWRVANMRLSSGESSVDAPGFWSGLLVHPLNPKAWAMILVGFTNFVESDSPTFFATLYIAASLLIIQIICHPIWTLFGDRIAKFIIGKKYERVFMWFLALVTVIFVLMALFA